MEKEIKTTRDSIFKGVARRMEWEGTRSPLEQDIYGRVSVSDADRTLFQSLFDEAAMHAIDICRPFLISSSNTDEALRMRISLPADSFTEELQLAIDNMLTTHVLAQWQEIVSPGRAATSYSRRDDYAAKILSILYHHRAPRRIGNYQFSDKH